MQIKITVYIWSILLPYRLTETETICCGKPKLKLNVIGLQLLRECRKHLHKQLTLLLVNRVSFLGEAGISMKHDSCKNESRSCQNEVSLVRSQALGNRAPGNKARMKYNCCIPFRLSSS